MIGEVITYDVSMPRDPHDVDGGAPLSDLFEVFPDERRGAVLGVVGALFKVLNCRQGVSEDVDTAWVVTILVGVVKG